LEVYIDGYDNSSMECAFWVNRLWLFHIRQETVSRGSSLHRGGTDDFPLLSSKYDGFSHRWIYAVAITKILEDVEQL
jgi:hypothetical protein